MSKKITLLIAFICTVSFSFAQYDVLDFETPATGNGFTWFQFGNAPTPDGTSLTNPANPVSGGINTSATVAQFDVNQTGQQWAGAFSEDIDPFMFDATNTTIKIKVYKPEISNMEIKFEPQGGGAAALVSIANTATNAWEEITLDFSAYSGNGVTYGRLVIIPDFQARTQTNTIYFDDIQVPDGNLATGPTTPAPTPTHHETNDNVLSVFSETYTTNTVSVSDFNPFWGQATVVTQEDLDAGAPVNNALKYANFNYQGTTFTADTDISGNGFAHLDFWSATEADFRIWFIDSDVGDQASYTVTISTPSAWGSVDIPLFIFQQGGVDMTKVDQIKIDNGDGGTIYFDNIYFHGIFDAPTTQGPAPIHNEVTDNVISVFSDAYTTDPTGVNYDPFWGQATDATMVDMGTGENVLQYVGLNYQGTDWAGDPQNVTGSTYLHFDYWAASNVSSFKMSIISPGQEHGIVPNGAITTGSWQSVDILVADFLVGNPNIDLTNIIQFKVDDAGTGDGGNIWFDNMYFHTGAPVPVEMATFEAYEEGSANILKWSTSTELNNSHFEVERSVNGSDFIKIGTVEGNGTTYEVSNYLFTDAMPALKTYYRLRQVDTDGSYEYSEVLAVKREKISTNHVKMYPLPVNTDLTIDYNAYTTDDVAIIVTNVTGQIVRTINTTAQQGFNQYTVNLSDLPSGSYFIQLRTNTDISSHTVIKQ